MSTIKIFISYSHQDTRRMEELRSFLQVLEDEGVEFWTDQRIATGKLWDEEIRKLSSTHFMKTVFYDFFRNCLA